MVNGANLLTMATQELSNYLHDYLRSVHIEALEQSPELVVFAISDLRGLNCPEPLMLLRQSLRTLESGQLCVAIATDPSTCRDFKSYCDFVGHKLIWMQQLINKTSDMPAVFAFMLRKK